MRLELHSAIEPGKRIELKKGEFLVSIRSKRNIEMIPRIIKNANCFNTKNIFGG